MLSDDATEQNARVAEISDGLAELAGVDVADVSNNRVGASWGEEITRKALRALVIFLVAITHLRDASGSSSRWRWPPSLALVHDVLVTVGVYSVTGLEVTPATVIAILTILGYSIYDGIVVFDKVDENTRLVSSTNRVTYTDMVNLSLNQTLMRSLNTQITALLPMLSLLVVGSLVLGATTLQEFAVALLIGQASGAYSSIFIASPAARPPEGARAPLQGRPPAHRGPRRVVGRRDLAHRAAHRRRRRGRRRGVRAGAVAVGPGRGPGAGGRSHPAAAAEEDEAALSRRAGPIGYGR